MAFKAADRVKEQTSSTGTGTLNLAGAVAQFETFVAGIGTTNTCNYCLLDANGTDWETGTGTVTSGSPDTLSRTTVFKSTNSGSKISLSSGTHTVFCTPPAGHLLDYSTELDNALGSTQGQIVYRGSTAWTALNPGTSGLFLKTQGASANPIWDTPSGGGGGGGSGLFAPIMSSIPTQANTGFTTWANQGSATATDTSVGIKLAAGSNGNAENFKILYKAAPTAPYTISALISLTSSFVNTEHVVAALGFYDGTKLEYVGMHIGSNGSNALGSIASGKYTSVSAGTGTDYGAPYPNPYWVQIEDDGTGLHLRVSMDGVSWKPLVEELYASFMGASPSHVFFGINPYGGIIYGGTLLSYTET